MATQRWYLQMFILIPLIYGVSSAALACLGWILDARDPNSATGFALLLGVFVANLPGAKTIRAIYAIVGYQHTNNSLAVLLYLGSIVITAIYLGILLFLVSRLRRRYQVGDK